MHIFDPYVSFQMTSSIVAGSVSLATGWANAEKIRKTHNVAVSFLGDAASEEGNVYESICFAQLHRLPVIYVCENNMYSICTPLCKREPTQNVADKFKSILYTRIVDGNDVIAVKNEIQTAVERAREGMGPSFIECKTYRLKDHHNITNGVEKEYRSLEEIKKWEENDPIIRYENILMEQRLLNNKEKHDIETRIETEINIAFQFAKKSELPKGGELKDGIWSD